MKTCHSCKQEKDLSFFKKNAKKKDGLQTICGECSKERNKIWYIQNREYKLQKTKQFKRTNVNWLKQYKQTLQCSICLENDFRCLDFHHINPDGKIGNVSEIARDVSLSKLKDEISKCIAVCANCHRKLTFDQREL